MKEISKKIGKNEIKQLINIEDTDFYTPQNVLFSWKDTFNFKKEVTEIKQVGLRNPQIGGIHAVLAHWSSSNDIATVVMPTGTGKTETMLSLLIKEQIQKLLIIVPTDPLRRQISDKFLKLGLLKELGIIGNIKHPIVGILKSQFDTTEDAELFFNSCNVVVATATILGYFEEEKLKVINKYCTHLFIDEAHHSEARTWFKIKDKFANKSIIQFTATPYRNDGKKIGKIIYSYPLKKAQSEGYFKPIDVVKVYEYSTTKSDKVIAERAIQQLKKDKLNYPHILLARVSTTNRAEEVYNIYQEYSEFRVVRIHSKLTAGEKKEIQNKILTKQVDVIVCVDMLGEGFDLPELKIAAFHDIRKSLPITLQFIGRFTRTKYDEELGNATIIVNLGNLEVKDELQELYAQDIDWNLLLPNISEKKNKEEIDYYNFLKGFSDSEDLEISLQSLKPAQSTVIFKNHTTSWFPSNFKKGLAGLDNYDVIRSTLNQDEKVLIIVTAKRIQADWTNNEEIFDFSWSLYIIYWETKNNLLFIHSSDTSSLHIDLAKAIIGEEAEIINGDKNGAIFRALSGIQRFKLQNVGLTEVLGKLIRFVMRVGSDIEPAMTQTQINKTKKAMIFGAGYEQGNETSIGCSYKGRIWSRRTTDIETFKSWCQKIGQKVTDESIDAEEILRGTLVPKSISSRPNIYPVYVDWGAEIYKHSETRFSFEGKEIYELYNSELILIDPSENGKLKIGLLAENSIIAEFELVLFTNSQNYNDFKFVNLDPTNDIYVRYGTKSLPIEKYFYEDTPVIWFANGDYLEGNNYIQLKSLTKTYDENRIIAWDWTGVDLSIEAQGVLPKITNSIQYKCLNELKNEDYDIIYDDDGSGEVADIVTIKATTDKIKIELYHLKYAKDGKISNQIKNLYEVCGQVQKSVNWKFKSNKELLEHLLRREIKKENLNSCSRFEKGTRNDLIHLIDLVNNRVALEFSIFLVQPSISKSSITEPQLTLLGVTENYLMERAMIPLKIIGSS